MEFTSRDITDNIELKNFLRTRVTADKFRVVDDYLMNIYNTDDVIDILNDKIKNHRPNVAKYVPVWKSHIKYLKKLSS